MGGRGEEGGGRVGRRCRRRLAGAAKCRFRGRLFSLECQSACCCCVVGCRERGGAGKHSFDVDNLLVWEHI